MPTSHHKITLSFILWRRRVLPVKQRLFFAIILILLGLLVVFAIPRGEKPQYCANVKPVIENNCPSDRTSFIAKLDYDYLDLLNENCESSGKLIYEPATTKIAIIVPYRRREKHLAIFLINMHRFLQAQGINYAIFVINQVDDNKFNRGGLLNVGFKEASKITSSDCFFFHDVDLIPESGNITYCCSPHTVIHYASAMSTVNFRMPYCEFHGGIVAATRAQFIKANGFANRFWGWGGEDDEFAVRVNVSGQIISHLSEQDGRFLMFQHERDVGNEPDPERTEKLLKTKEEWQTDGLNSLNYTLIAVEQRRLYTEIKVKF